MAARPQAQINAIFRRFCGPQTATGQSVPGRVPVSDLPPFLSLLGDGQAHSMKVRRRGKVVVNITAIAPGNAETEMQRRFKSRTDKANRHLMLNH